jgi:thiol-disulfide isomerase/thioredoxin
MPQIRRAIGWVTVLCLCVSPAVAASAEGEGFQLPAGPAKWVNSGPISLATLQGKGAVLWFYEEGCPRCREKWPSMLELAKKYEGQPVMFIGVNSGNSRADVEHYAKAVGCKWPIIVDDTREFERQCGFENPISLQNIHQAGYIDPQGRFHMGSWSDLDRTVESALKGAEWKIDPVGIPAPLKSAWLAVEFGNPATAATNVKKGLASPKADLKEAATKLNEAVQAEIAKLVAAADQSAAAGNKWQAYQTYQGLAAQYGGYDIPDEAKAAAKELAADPDVKRQFLAQKAFDTAMKMGASARTPTARKSAVNKMKSVVENFDGTDAAKEAQKILQQLDSRESTQN